MAMNRGGPPFAKCIVACVMVFLVATTGTWLLWNWLVPDLFNGPTIHFGQAAGLLILSKLLFWGFGGKSYNPYGSNADQSCKSQYREKLAGMSAEERAAFKQKMKAKWCRWDKRSADDQRPLEP